MNIRTQTYQYPSTSFHVQRVTSEHFIANKRAYCLNALGTGKTRSGLFAFDCLYKLSLVTCMLVIAPLSSLERTWAREIKNEFPWLKYRILHGSKATRLKRLQDDVQIYIINHDGVGTILQELLTYIDINLILVDELGAYRNGGSARTKILKTLIHNKEWAWGLTGAPIPHAVTDVWGPCSAITPGTVPKYFTAFRAQLMYKQGPFKWIPKPHSEERAVACMRPAVRYTLDDVTELPDRVLNYYETTLTHHPYNGRASQYDTYESMRKTAIAICGDKTIDALNKGAAMNKLLQVALGWAYTRKGDIIPFDNTPRLQLILDLIDSSLKKVILFASFKSAVNALSDMLTRNDIDHAIVTGDTSLSKRNIIFHDFQETNKYKCLLCHPTCMAHSLTLTAASTIIWSGPITSLDIFNQANARIYRVGQKYKTLIAMIGGTPVEHKIYTLLGNNEQLQDRFLEILTEQTREDS